MESKHLIFLTDDFPADGGVDASVGLQAERWRICRPETFRQVGDVAAEIVHRLMTEHLAEPQAKGVGAEGREDPPVLQDTRERQAQGRSEEDQIKEISNGLRDDIAHSALPHIEARPMLVSAAIGDPVEQPSERQDETAEEARSVVGEGVVPEHRSPGMLYRVVRFLLFGRWP